MNIKKIKIIFLSNGLFGLPTFKELIKKKLNIIYTITSKKNKINKKKNFIKYLSKKKKIKLIYSEYINKKKNILKIKKSKPDLLIIISFKILKKKIWNIPKIGSINIHPSLLPQYKGSNPINWVIINGEKNTGLTSFFINEKIDEGKIILQKKIKIKKNINYDKLYNLLSIKSKNFVIKTIKNIINNKKFTKVKINKKKIILAPKINNFFTKIFFFIDIKKIYNKIKGLSKKKSAWCFLNTKNNLFIINIYKIKIIIKKHNFYFGQSFFFKKKIYISAKNGFIILLKCKLENKKEIKNINIYNGLINYKNIYFF
ncbi:MAG: methionyl-tRNA formyltransferase [Candidatus Shikimatogenerans bostrichidophilus]|nr:MAG: methionyl-tRNA formyltransferase [Candidatus Shikimatogenerans bostrichidophilus]